MTAPPEEVTNGQRRHIALIGFMGAGKTTVGRKLAELLGHPFIDLDEEIVARSGRSISDIFAKDGEAAFRSREREALARVVARQQAVVLAPGGGAFVDVDNRALIKSAALTVFLKTSAETIASRVLHGAQRAKRPMLEGPDPLATVRRLLDERSPMYAQADMVVDTDTLGPDDVARAIVQALEEVRSRTHTDNATTDGPLLSIRTSTGIYPIELRAEAGPWLATAIRRACPGDRISVITETHVRELHAEPFVQSLRATGLQVSLHSFSAGEDSKTLSTVEHLYDTLLDEGLSRGDALVALGGGVVGDVTGFVASTLLRGIRFVQVPTTTLAAVDSSVGGKTGVNTRRGKNLVGTFYPPAAVLLAGSHLRTLPRRTHAAGLVEALKMAATMDATLFDDIERTAAALLRFDDRLLLPTIARAIGLKAAIVERDEREEGVRAVLNYGHTIGHAIEAGEHYQILHGEAVGLGMVAEAEWAVENGFAPHGMAARLRRALQTLEMPVDWRQRSLDLRALGLDKKREGGGLRLPVVSQLGCFEMRSVPLADIVRFIGGGGSS